MNRIKRPNTWLHRPTLQTLNGLASSTEKPYEIWQAFVTEFAAAEHPNTGVMGGFLSGLQKRDSALADKMLDEAVEHPSIGRHFPDLQARIAIDGQGVKRLHRALELGEAPIIPGPAFRDLLLAIASKPGGVTVSLEILSMRLFSDAADKRSPAPELAEAGRALLQVFEFHEKDRRTDREDQELGRIAQVSLAGDEGIPIVRQIVRKMMAAISRRDIHAHDQDDLMTGLLRVEPAIVLDEAFSGDAAARAKAVQAFEDFQRFRKNPLEIVPDDVLLAWCDLDPTVRYPIMAAAPLFKRPTNNDPHDWLPLASKLIAKAPDPDAVLKEIVGRLRPRSWSGSLAAKLEGRLRLLERLTIDQSVGLADALDRAKAWLLQWIAAERKREASESRERSGRFED